MPKTMPTEAEFVASSRWICLLGLHGPTACPPLLPFLLPCCLRRRPVSIPCPLAGEVIVFYIIALLSISTRKNQQRATTNCRRGVPDSLRHYLPLFRFP